MKHIKMFLLVAIMLIVPTMLFAQGDTDPLDLSEYAGSFGAFVSTVLLLTQMIRDWGKIKGTVLIILSWGLGVILSIGGYYGDVGFFEPLTLLDSVLYGVGASAVANGLAGLGVVQMIISFVIGTYKKNKRAKDSQ